MKKKVISIILVAILLMTQIGVFAKDYSDYPQRFWDVPKDHWAFGYISELVDKGVLNGYEDGSFRPDDTVTRAEWAKIMVLAAGLPLVYGFETPDRYFDSHFWDMHDHWANPYVNAAEDYLASYGDGSFKPDQAAVREDVTVSMVKLKGYDVSKVDYSYLSRFSDMNSISNSLKAYVAVAVEKELIDGFEDGTFRGQDTLTRAEAATLLWRAFQYGEDIEETAQVPADELKKIEEMLNTPEVNGFVSRNFFDTVEDINLNLVFREYNYGESHAKEIDDEYLIEADLEELYTPLSVVSTGEIKKIYKKYTGKDISDSEIKNRLNFLYLPKYDVYCYMHGDTNRITVKCANGIKESDNTYIITIDYEDVIYYDDKEITSSVLTLKKNEDSYVFVSHIIKEAS